VTAILVNTFFEDGLQNLFDLAERIERAFAAAGLDYRIVGGLAAYLYIEQAIPDAGRLTRDIDVVVRREDIQKIADVVEQFGLEYRRAAGIDMLVQKDQPSARRAIHLLFAGEKVRPDYPEAAPNLGKPHNVRGLRLVALSDLVRMKLTSFRLKDQTHLKDLDEAGLITPEIEEHLSELLLQRLQHVRDQE